MGWCYRTVLHTSGLGTLRIGYGALKLTTPAKKTLFSAKNWQFLAIFGRKLFFFVLTALQPPICCSDTTANTFQWVLSDAGGRQ